MASGKNSLRKSKARQKALREGTAKGTSTWVMGGKVLSQGSGTAKKKKDVKRPVGGQGGRKSRYSSGVNRDSLKTNPTKVKRNKRGRKIS